MGSSVPLRSLLARSTDPASARCTNRPTEERNQSVNVLALVECKCHVVQVGPGESSFAGRMGFPDELAHSGFPCNDHSNVKANPHELSVTVDNDRREMSDHEEAPRMESSAQLHATSHTESDVVSEPLCPICLEDSYESPKIKPWRCEHSIHSACWEEWMASTSRSAQPEDMLTLPICANCRAISQVDYAILMADAEHEATARAQLEIDRWPLPSAIEAALRHHCADRMRRCLRATTWTLIAALIMWLLMRAATQHQMR
ncbi:hypothetical protein PCASD_26708 [Puccinia coronata f. sp. avenae]|uniref:RING-type domain-containing protein n=2 Tax=Puccinia coronata f. sp. avenae TaxID=200324 RepID=A0A2N5TIK4_9BASI|nr:hypothetical protein PCASD_26708 [Puccinia coronata f. sp. avenae]